MIERNPAPPHHETVVSMREYIKERCLTFTRHHHAVLRAFAEHEQAAYLAEREQQARLFYVKMGNVALQRQLHEEDRYPEEFDDMYEDEL